MATQVQCPNCGGFRVSSTVTYEDPITRQQTVGGTRLGCFLSIVVMVLAFLAVPYAVAFIGFLVIVHKTNPTPADMQNLSHHLNGPTWTTVAVASTIVGTLLLGLLALFLFHLRRRRKIAKSITVYHSVCDLCGKQWTWDEGKPAPVHQVQSDVIQKGAKKIEEERAAAAWYWEQQQRDKKKKR